MLKSCTVPSSGLTCFPKPRLARHKQVTFAPTIQACSAVPHMLQLRFEELKQARGYQGWTEEEYEDRVLELATLVPSIVEQAQRFPAALLLALLDDTDSIANRLISLKQLFPAADVFRIVYKRPRLLLEEEFKGAEIAAVKLGQLFPDTDVSMLAEKAPLLLVEEVDDIVSDLRRLFPKTKLLGQHLITAPHIILSIQRGSKALGPAAEF